MRWRCILVSVLWGAVPCGLLAQGEVTSPQAPVATITAQSSLVLVPALVKRKAGEVVFSLTAEDFVLTDDGVPQRLRLEPDTDAQPLALVVVVETGGLGAMHLRDYTGLDATLEAVIGAVPHHVALVTFDSATHLEQPFTTDTSAVEEALDQLEEGDNGAAILDGLRFGIDLLRKQPTGFRRALLLLSETADSGSQTSLDEALRAVNDTNTSIYSFGFSTTKSALKHEGAKLPNPINRTVYSKTPYAAGGCMSREPGADPDAHGSWSVQALDCAGDLFPPVRIARLAFLAATDGLRTNVPETVARLTGGEYFAFKDARSLARNLVTVSNDVPNHYVLSFAPQGPHPGLHALQLRMKNRPELELRARSAYWAEAPAQGTAP